jgi:uncharacterized protein
MASNQFLLAADNSPELLPLLREIPSLASEQDEHGYSLVHAAASYNHLDLLRALVREFNVNVDIRDEDDETALFVVETVAAAKVLIEELGADVSITGSDGLTAREKIEVEAEFPAVVEYLRDVEVKKASQNSVPTATQATTLSIPSTLELPPIPEGLSVTMGTMDEADVVAVDIDPEFKRRIDQLAERDDFNSLEGQAELRRLVEDAIADQGLAADRNVRQRQD